MANTKEEKETNFWDFLIELIKMHPWLPILVVGVVIVFGYYFGLFVFSDSNDKKILFNDLYYGNFKFELNGHFIVELLLLIFLGVNYFGKKKEIKVMQEEINRISEQKSKDQQKKIKKKLPSSK